MPRVYGKAVKKIERPSPKAGDWVTVEAQRCHPETRGIAWSGSEWVFIGDRRPNASADPRMEPFIKLLKEG